MMPNDVVRIREQRQVDFDDRQICPLHTPLNVMDGRVRGGHFFQPARQQHHGQTCTGINATGRTTR